MVLILIISAYLCIAVEMAKSVYSDKRCVKVYNWTSSIIAVFLTVISVSLALAYFKLKTIMKRCSIFIDQSILQRITIMFAFLVSSFFAEMIYQIYSILSSYTSNPNDLKKNYVLYMVQDVTPIIFDATSTLVILILHYKSFL